MRVLFTSPIYPIMLKILLSSIIGVQTLGAEWCAGMPGELVLSITSWTSYNNDCNSSVGWSALSGWLIERWPEVATIASH